MARGRKRRHFPGCTGTGATQAEALSDWADALREWKDAAGEGAAGMSELRDPGEFAFCFMHGTKSASEMTREELLHVIAHLMDDYERNNTPEAMRARALGRVEMMLDRDRERLRAWKKQATRRRQG